MKMRIPLGIGLSSLLVIFCALCLSIFSLLSLSSARADGRLAEKSRDASCAYYEADTKAQEILARLRAGEMPEAVREEEGVYFYQCPISDTQLLAVEVKLVGEQYEILRWQAVSTTQWEADTSIEVWEGE